MIQNVYIPNVPFPKFRLCRWFIILLAKAKQPSDGKFKVLVYFETPDFKLVFWLKYKMGTTLSPKILTNIARLINIHESLKPYLNRINYY